MKRPGPVPIELKTCVLKVTSYQRQVLCGTVYNPFFSGCVPFEGPMALLQLLDGLFDELRFPRNGTRNRTFADQSEADRRALCADPEAPLATFQLQVQFRQNASWQGSLLWLDRGQENSFRSFRELLYLLDSALTGE